MAVQDTFRTYNGDGVTTDFAIPFTYELPAEVKLTLDGVVITSWTFVNPSVLRLASPLLINSILTIERVTNIDSPAVVWKNGSGTTGGQLNAMVRQLINAMQEARDTALRGLFRLPTGVYDFVNARAVNLGTPTGANDAATKSYVDGLVGGALSYAGQALASAIAAAASAADALAGKVGAETARDKAQAWADANSGVQVETGKYSAKHWAALAQAIAGGASAAATPFTPVGTIAATNVQTAIQELDAETQASFGTTNTNVTNLTTTVGTKASKRNRVLNPAFQISQEFGPNAGTPVAGAGKYILDGFFLSNTTDATILGSQSTGLVTPAGSPYRLGASVSVADTSLAAGQVAGINFYVEGVDAADLQWGVASAKTIVVRFVFRTTMAGTYGFSVTNASGTRSYVQTFTVAVGEVNTDKLVTFVVPGDTTGAWATNNTRGLECRIALASGSTFLTGSTGWQAGNFVGITGSQVNWVNSTSSQAFLADVGLYEGSAVPTFEVSNYADELRRCQRYYEKTKVTTSLNLSTYPPSFPWRVNKRTLPTLSAVFDSGTGGVYSTMDVDSFYQSTAHSAVVGAFVTGNARL